MNYEMNRGLDVLEENGGALILGNLVPMMLLNVLHLQTVVSIIPAAHLLRTNLINTTLLLRLSGQNPITDEIQIPETKGATQRFTTMRLRELSFFIA